MSKPRPHPPQTLKRKKRQAFSKKDDVGRKKSQDVNGVPRRSLGASFPPPSMSCIAMLLPSHDHSVAPELGGGAHPNFFIPGTSHDITSTSFTFFLSSQIHHHHHHHHYRQQQPRQTIDSTSSKGGGKRKKKIRKKRKKKLTNSKTINNKLLTTNGHLRPYRSAAIPKRIAPIDRSISTSVMPHVMSVLVLPKSSASSSTVRETVKKSKASHVYFG